MGGSCAAGVGARLGRRLPCAGRGRCHCPCPPARPRAPSPPECPHSPPRSPRPGTGRGGGVRPGRGRGSGDWGGKGRRRGAGQRTRGTHGAAGAMGRTVTVPGGPQAVPLPGGNSFHSPKPGSGLSLTCW
ncbi:hypothetical protein G4228_007965 [Cervus hanglu yarkandensis]|nr:hypothetical protein G4228_007965 [Cervus hanglu yarkandensis]